MCIFYLDKNLRAGLRTLGKLLIVIGLVASVIFFIAWLDIAWLNPASGILYEIARDTTFTLLVSSILAVVVGYVLVSSAKEIKEETDHN